MTILYSSICTYDAFSYVVFVFKASRATILDTTAASLSTASLPGHTTTIGASAHAFAGHCAMLCSQCYVAWCVGVGSLQQWVWATYRGCGDPT